MLPDLADPGVGPEPLRWRARPAMASDPLVEDRLHASPEASVRFEAPWGLPFEVDPDAGESFVTDIFRRPPKRIIDLLERAPDFAAVSRNLPDAL